MRDSLPSPPDMPPPAGAQRLDPHGERVLVVDDVPDNLALLHDALDEAGYTVLAATSGEAALARAVQARPDIVLLDAVMPGLDGFEVARRLKADPATAHIPVIFMTGLTETEHLVAALEAGGVDYVTKPVAPREVLARMQVHLRSARERRQARQALDAFGYASIALRASTGRLLWQTPLARELLRDYFGSEGPMAPPALLDWLRQQTGALSAGAAEAPRWGVERRTAHGVERLSFALHQRIGADGEPEEQDWLIVMRQHSDHAVIASLSLSFGLTAREAEVLYWVIQGKINRDIADILGASPATVKKHLERIHAKLGVETRTAAAAMALQRVRDLHPGWAG